LRRRSWSTVVSSLADTRISACRIDGTAQSGGARYPSASLRTGPITIPMSASSSMMCSDRTAPESVGRNYLGPRRSSARIRLVVPNAMNTATALSVLLHLRQSALRSLTTFGPLVLANGRAVVVWLEAAVTGKFTAGCLANSALLEKGRCRAAGPLIKLGISVHDREFRQNKLRALDKDGQYGAQ
jgi:hypothetical protein